MVRKGTRKAALKESETVSQNVQVSEQHQSEPVKPTKAATRGGARRIKKAAGPHPESSTPIENKKKLSLLTLFDNVQFGKISEEKALAILTHLYSQANGSAAVGVENAENVEHPPSATEQGAYNEEFFAKVMTEIILQNFEVAVKSVPVERSLKLLANFVCYCLDKELKFVETFASIIKSCSDDVRRWFRHRVCLLILLVMTKCANDETDLDDTLWTLMRDTLIVRSRDKFTEIRLLAVKALMYFQPQLGEDPEEGGSEDTDGEGAGHVPGQPRKLENDPVVRHMAYLLEYEQSGDIRRVILEAAQINNTTMLKCVIRHCRDVDISCRAAVLNSMAHSVSIKALSAQQRVDILTIAFRNCSSTPGASSPRMDKAVKNLTIGWLSQVGGQIPDLLILVDPVCYPALCEQLVNSILDSVPIQQAVDSVDILDHRKLLEDQWCKPEYMFLWVCLLKFLKHNNQSELFDSLCPNITTFAQYIAYHFRRVKETNDDDEIIVRTFVNQQLLEIAAILDYSMDEMGRKNMTRVLEAHLKDSSSNEYSRLVSQEMSVLLTLLGRQKFVHACLDAISELRFPIGGTSSDDIHITNLTDNSKNMTDVSKRAIDTTAVVTEENKDGAVDAKPDEQKTDDVPTEKTPPPPPAFDEKVLMEMQYKAAQMRVQIHKQRDVMDQCVCEQNFIKAQEEKETLAKLEAELRTQQIAINNYKTQTQQEQPTNHKCAAADEGGAGNEGSSEMEVDKENNDKGSESEANAGKGASAEEVSNQASPKDVGGISDSQESLDHVAVFHWLSIAHRIPQMVFFHTFPMALTELRGCLVARLATSVDAIRLKTVQCVGVYSIFDRDYATQMLPLIVQVLIMDRKESVQVTAFRVLMDLLLRYGLGIATAAGDPLTQDSLGETGLMDLTSLNDTFLNHVPIVDQSQSRGASVSSGNPGSSASASAPCTDEEEEEEEATASASLIKLIVKYLDNVVPEMRSVAAEGLAKLLLHDRVASADIFARLCILWFSPTSKHDMYLRQCLGQFFPLFAVKSAKHQDCVRRAFLPIVRTIYKAPLTSPLAMIDCELLARYLVTLTSPANESLVDYEATALDHVKQAAVHERLGKQLCEEILRNPVEMYVPVLVKALSYIQVDENSAILPQSQFLQYLSQIDQVVDPSQNHKLLQKLMSTVSGTGDGSSSSSQVSKLSIQSEDAASHNSSRHSVNRILQASVLLNQSSITPTPGLVNMSSYKTMLSQTPKPDSDRLDDSSTKQTPKRGGNVSTIIETSPLAEIDESSVNNSELLSQQEPESPRKRKKRVPNKN